MLGTGRAKIGQSSVARGMEHGVPPGEPQVITSARLFGHRMSETGFVGRIGAETKVLRPSGRGLRPEAVRNTILPFVTLTNVLTSILVSSRRGEIHVQYSSWKTSPI
jgi:hypothetical protein